MTGTTNKSAATVEASKRGRTTPQPVPRLLIAVLTLATATSFSFWVGTILSPHILANVLGKSGVVELADVGLSYPMTNATAGGTAKPPHKVDHFMAPTNGPTLPQMADPLRVRDDRGMGISSPTTALRTVQLGDDSRPQPHCFEETIVHSVMVTADPPPQTVAIVVAAAEEGDGAAAATTILSAQALVNQVLMHRSIKSVLVAIVDAEGNEKNNQECTELWKDSPVAVDCVFMGRGMASPPPILDGASVDVAIVVPRFDALPRNDSVEIDDSEHPEGPLSPFFWFGHLSTNGVFVTVLGRTLPLEHPRALRRQQSRMKRLVAMQKAGFKRLVDYDVPNRICSPPTTVLHSHPINVGVAFKSADAIARWRMNEAQYQLRLRERLVKSQVSMFDGATMIALKYPPKHSAVRFCSSSDDEANDVWEPNEDCLEGHGYDPLIPAIPLSDLYVAKSKAGDNAGRGVFTNVDIPANAYVGLETTVYSIHFDWPTSALRNNMLEHFKHGFAELDSTIVSIYAEAYGYSYEQWGLQQDSVMSHFLTFVNHGCNSTSNLGRADLDPDINELTIDLEAPIPEALRSTVSDPYNPHFDRDHGKHSTNCVAAKDIAKGDELYDNYMSFGGDQYFEEMILTLRKECSGIPGMVERYQRSGSNENIDALFDFHMTSSPERTSQRADNGMNEEL